MKQGDEGDEASKCKKACEPSYAINMLEGDGVVVSVCGVGTLGRVVGD